MRDEMYPYRDRLYDWAGGENQESHFRPDPARYPSEFLDAIRERRFAAIYTDGSDQQGDYVYKFIVENYRPVHVWDATSVAEPRHRRLAGLPPARALGAEVGARSFLTQMVLTASRRARYSPAHFRASKANTTESHGADLPPQHQHALEGQHLRRRCSSAAGGLWLMLELNRSPYVTQRRRRARAAGAVQPRSTTSAARHRLPLLPHRRSRQSASAGIPPTKTCMNCHSQIWTDSPMLEPVRASFRTDESIQWIKVHDLPDFVYFNHSVHVNKGVGCATCHGRVDQMPLMWQENSLQMEWCLDCHRNPEQYVRPQGRGLQHGVGAAGRPARARAASW